MSKPAYNPERRAWRGRSYKKGGENVRQLRDKALIQTIDGRRCVPAWEHEEGAFRHGDDWFRPLDG